MHYFNRKLDINNLKFELMVLLALPAGYAAGWVALQILRATLGL
jgi:hypothetical protein